MIPGDDAMLRDVQQRGLISTLVKKVADLEKWVREHQGAPASGFRSATRVYHSINQNINTGVATALAFDTESFDIEGLHDTVINNSRITFITAGKYHVGGIVTFDNNSTSWRDADIFMDGLTIIAEQRIWNIGAVQDTWIIVDTIYQFTAGQYIELRATQNSGGLLAINATAGVSPVFWAYRIA